MDRLLRHIEPALHVALLGTAVLAAWAYVSSEETGTSRTPLVVRADSSQALAEWRPAEWRVLLFLSPTCPYCARSMDFFARLSQVVDSLQRAEAPVAIAAVIDAADSPQVQRRMLRASKVRVDTLLQIAAFSLAPVGVSGVPTIAVLGAQGQTHSAWTGLQKPAEERAILATLRGMGAGP